MSHDHANVLPRGALGLCFGIVALSLAVTVTARVTGMAPSASPVLLRSAEHVRPVASRDLRFTDRADGAVVIADVTDGRPAGLVAPGSKSGFIRGVMRGLARDRHMRGIGDGPAFRLTQWADGELSLTDLATGRAIELTAFGATNRAAFAALLPGDARMSRGFDIPARVALERSDENLFAHVDIGIDVRPGDSFRLLGPPIRLGFGERAEFIRMATVRRASPLRRLWTRFAGHFALTELYEVSFSPRSRA